MSGWTEIGDGAFVRRHDDLDLNCGLVTGEDRCLVVDTRSNHAQGRELAEAVREVTGLEPVVVNTHAHYDHCFGNAAFRDSQIYAHAGAVDSLVTGGERQRDQVVQQLITKGRVEDAHAVRETEIVPPHYLVEADTAVGLGGREVHLLHGGRGHTDHDLVVAVPDAGVVFWGDLVEEGADPAMEDAFPMEWGPTLSALVAHEHVAGAYAAVPGHGAPVDPQFVAAQADLLSTLGRTFHDALESGEDQAEGLVEAAAGTGLEVATLRIAAARAMATSGSGDR